MPLSQPEPSLVEYRDHLLLIRAWHAPLEAWFTQFHDGPQDPTLLPSVRRLPALDADAIDEKTLAPYFRLAGLPPVDLFIRTGGEMRISNFLLWQVAYAELYFTDALWPDVDATILGEALAEFARRERRYGLTSTQIRAAS